MRILSIGVEGLYSAEQNIVDDETVHLRTVDCVSKSLAEINRFRPHAFVVSASRLDHNDRDTIQQIQRNYPAIKVVLVGETIISAVKACIDFSDYRECLPGCDTLNGRSNKTTESKLTGIAKLPEYTPSPNANKAMERFPTCSELEESIKMLKSMSLGPAERLALSDVLKVTRQAMASM